MNNKCMFEGCEHIAQVAVPAKMGLNNEDVTLYLCNEHYSKFGKMIQPTSISMSVLDKNMDNEFFNFDAVVEIEKRKSYNQAIEDFFMKVLEAYHDDKLNECELCNIERQLKEKIEHQKFQEVDMHD